MVESLAPLEVYRRHGSLLEDLSCCEQARVLKEKHVKRQHRCDRQGKRGTCIGAITFGSACSYQLGATFGVFAAAGRPGLVLPYLLVLVITTLTYTRLIAPAPARSAHNALLIDKRTFWA